MEKVQITRIADNGTQTLGKLLHSGILCDTLELAFNGNQTNISCIPTGIYTCKWTRSNRLSRLKGKDVFAYEVLDVPDRSGIRIHSANFASQLLGCISLGQAEVDINGDGDIDLINSRNTVNRFNDLMAEQDFELTII